MFGDVTPIPQYNRSRSPAVAPPDLYSRSPAAPDLYSSSSEELFCDLIPRTDPPEYNYYYLTPPSMLQKNEEVAEVTVMGRVDNATYTIDTPAQSPVWVPRYTSEALETSWTPCQEHFMTPCNKQQNDATQPFVTPGQSSHDITPPFKTPLLHQPGNTPGFDHDTTPIQQQHPGVTPPLATPRRMCGEAFIRARCIPESHGYGHNDSMMVNISDATLYTTNDVTNDIMTSRGDDVITVAAADSSSSSPFLAGGTAASSFSTARIGAASSHSTTEGGADKLNTSSIRDGADKLKNLSLTDVEADTSFADELNCTLEVHSDTSSVDVGTQADLLSYAIPPPDPTTTETIKRAIVSPSYPANKRMRVTARPPLHNHRKPQHHGYQGNGYHSYHGNPVENTFNDNLQLHPENASCVIQ
eukprot:sb/3465137/